MYKEKLVQKRSIEQKRYCVLLKQKRSFVHYYDLPVKKCKRTVMIKRLYQCGFVVYQLAKLLMLELYYDFLDNYFSRQEFELCYMDTD